MALWLKQSFDLIIAIKGKADCDYDEAPAKALQNE